MQNHQPIGIFDSGIGGLSVLKEIQQLLPGEDILYIADSAYAPYGNKPQNFIRQRCDQLTQFLIEQGAKAIVIACNTATAVSVKSLREKYSLPIIAMEPGVKPAIEATRSGVIGVMATENTLASEQFVNLVHRYAKEVKVVTQPCPGLVEQIETGDFSSEEIDRLIDKYTRPLIDAGADTVVLGCTHYPLIKDRIVELIGTSISIIETGEAVARQLQRQLENMSISETETSLPDIKLWTSSNPQQLTLLTDKIFNHHGTAQPLPDFEFDLE